jgi:hypothetical protein
LVDRLRALIHQGLACDTRATDHGDGGVASPALSGRLASEKRTRSGLGVNEVRLPPITTVLARRTHHLNNPHAALP